MNTANSKRVLLSIHEGLTEALELELERYDLQSLNKGKSYCTIEVSEEKLATLLYQLQTPTQAMEILAEFDFKDIDDIPEKIALSKQKIPLAKRHMIRATRVGEHPFKSPDIVDYARQALKQGNDLDEAVYRVYVEDNHCFVGFELAEDLSRRDYRIFTNNASVKGSVAAALAIFAGCKPNQTIIDPFCKDGTIAIEAAFLTSGLSVRRHSWEQLEFFKTHKIKPDIGLFARVNESDVEKTKIIAMDNSNHNLAAAKKNLQIAEIGSRVRLLREDLEWLTTRFDDSSIDKIVSVIPSPTLRFPENKIRRVYKNLFEALVVLNGKLCALMQNPTIFLEESKSNGLKLVKDIRFKMGKQAMHVVILEK